MSEEGTASRMLDLLVLLADFLTCPLLQPFKGWEMPSPASSIAAAQEAGDGSPAWAQDTKCTVLLWGLLCASGLKIAPKALWGILSCQRIVFLSWQEVLALEFALSSR